ncbi:MAG: hypothetical protein CW742_14300 [Methanoregula sp.]|nr:MAG: hypothetical protein CW742_14300 [Methanoregula sp.]
MVKVQSMGNPAAAEIVRMRDLVGSSQPGRAAVQGVAQAPDLLSTAQGAVSSLDQYIKLADQGVTMLGKVEGILTRVQQIRAGPQSPGPGRGPGPAQQHPPGPLMEAPAGMVINADPAHRNPPPAALPAPALQPPQEAPAPCQKPKIPLGAIVQALDMIAGAQKGITVEELSAAIKRNPNEVQHILDTFAGSM